MSEPKESRRCVAGPNRYGGTITARVETDPSKLPPLRWVERDGSYRMEAKINSPILVDGVLFDRCLWREVPLWIEPEAKT